MVLVLNMHAQVNRYAFPNVLNVATTVIECSFFSDKGAWFAYALPEKKENYGSFTGPLLMEMEGKWLANTIAQLNIIENGKAIDLSMAKANNCYYPGLLKQEYTIENLVVTVDLLFVNNKEAHIQTTITNTSKILRKLRIAWKGQVILSSINLISSPNQIEFAYKHKPYAFTITYQTNQPVTITISNQSYTAQINEVEIPAHKSIAIVQSQQYYPNKTMSGKCIQTSVDFKKELQENETRWNGYLSNYFTSGKIADIKLQRLAVKSIITLISNWRCAAGDLLHDGAFPSTSFQGFYGFWSWDSWKQAVGFSYFNLDLAKSNVLAMFDYQDEAGMIADCIYYNKVENNWRDTKAPLAAWAVLQIAKQAKDIQFMKDMYPKLVKYHNWWYANRDYDKNGLCEFGSTDGTKIAAKWESGMDNALRFDHIALLKNNDKAWSIDKESVDLNAFLYEEKNCLAELAKMIGNTLEATMYLKDAEALKILTNDYFFNKNKGFYYDRQLGKGDFCAIEGCEGWTALWAGIPNKEQAKQIMEMMQNSNKFNSFVPLPTLCIDAIGFDPENGYWRGPVWIDQVYFGLAGLKNYGNEILYQQLKNKLLHNAEGIFDDLPIRENYHPSTGKGLNAKNFSWSAAHLLMILKQ